MKQTLISKLTWLNAVIIQVSLALYLHAAPDLPAGARVLRDLSYVTNGHSRQKLDLYLPASPKGPLIVYIHGGGWLSDTKEHVEGLALLAQGYSIASLDYRFSSDAVFPAQIEDCKAAIRWLRAHAREYGYDPQRVGAWGASAGGHLTALLATTGKSREFDVGEHLDQSSAILCGIDLFGPADLPGYQPLSTNPLLQRSGSESIFVRLLGGPVEEKLELARKASPVTWVSKDSAPLLIMHGTADPLIPLEQSQRLADKLKAAGVEVTLDVVKDGGHGGPQFWAEDRPQRFMDFWSRYLKPSKPWTNDRNP
jgi:acetyl esterase/lipase